MAKTKIEWTATPMPGGTLMPGYTFNPWQGCTKKSPGCKNCYAEAMTKRFIGDGFWGPQGKRKFQSDDYWKKPITWNTKAEKLGVGLKVFCGSMCDVFEIHQDKDISIRLNKARFNLCALIDYTPNLDWLLLTKRPENIMRLGWTPGYFGLINHAWLGTSVENQEMADLRIPELLKIPAKVRFLSCEPLLEEINLRKYLAKWDMDTIHFGGDKIQLINWVIVGGESGPRKRPFNPDWARSLRDQCKEAGVPYFMKQINKIDPIPDDLMIREFPNG